MLELLLAGAFGGLVRGIVGYLKYQFAYRRVKLNPLYLLVMVGLSAVVGAAASWVVSESGLEIPGITKLNPAIAFIVGYAGGDFIENLYKILIGKITLYPLGKK